MAISWPFPKLSASPDMIRTIRGLCGGLNVVVLTYGLGKILYEFMAGQTGFLVQ